MFEQKIDPDAARQYSERVNPNESTSLENIGKALALIHRGIPVTPKLQEKLYGEVVEGLDPTFDYVDLDTSSIAKKVPEDEGEIKKQFDFFKQKGWYKNGIFIDGMFKGLTYEQFREKFIAEKQSVLAEEGPTVPGAELNINSQADAVGNDMGKLLDSPDTDQYQLFLKTLRQDPGRPFLIINGHMVAEGFLNKSLVIGEEEGELAESVPLVLDKLDAKQYSAVLLVACNEARVKVKSIPGTAIFYADSLIGKGANVRGLKRPAKHS